MVAILKSGKKFLFQGSPWFWAFFMLTVVVGVFLRLYLISDQVLLDDEWHALDFSINHSLWYLLTHFSRTGANTIPLNAYVRLLLISAGWSEFMLILPSLVAGIAGLLLFPLVLKRIFSDRVAIFFGMLFAFSPLIIFYNRVCRPYSIYTFLGFLSLWIVYEWALTGKKRFGVLFALIGILCVYFFFVGVIFVFVPLGCVFIVKLMLRYPSLMIPREGYDHRFGHRRGGLYALPFRAGINPAPYGRIGRNDDQVSREQIIPDFKELIIVACGILICLSVILATAIIQRIPSMNLNQAQFTIQSVLGFAQILSGTSNFFLSLFFYTLLIFGQIRLFRKSFLLGFIFINVFAAYGVVSLITKLHFAHVPLVLTRYIIPAFPMGYVLVALGLDSLWKAAALIPVNQKYTNILCYGVAGCFLAGLFWTGPLRQTYAAPNNFTNHSAFQESYAPFEWAHPRISEMIQRPYVISKNTMPDFYKTLAGQPEVKKLIEYPMLLGNHFNLFYYYQRFHKKHVAVGYTRSIKDSPDSQTGGILGDMIVDQVLSQIKDPGQLKFKNMVDILDMAAVKNSGADLVVFHKNMEAEILEPQIGNKGTEVPLVSAVSAVYQKIFGAPVFEDRHLVVFRVHN